MQNDIIGECLCGATRVTVSSPPKFGIRCFCTDCQKATGGGSAPAIGCIAADVTISGDLKHHHGTSDAGSDLSFGFCGNCGTPMTKTTSKAPDLMFIYAGTLTDPSVVPPLRDVFEGSRQGWDR